MNKIPTIEQSPVKRSFKVSNAAAHIAVDMNLFAVGAPEMTQIGSVEQIRHTHSAQHDRPAIEGWNRSGDGGGFPPRHWRTVLPLPCSGNSPQETSENLRIGSFSRYLDVLLPKDFGQRSSADWVGRLRPALDDLPESFEKPQRAGI